jgi:hypothetical protein
MLTPRMWGVELECAGPVDRSILRQALGRAGLSAESEGYGHNFRSHWKLTTDGSIRADNRHYGHEIVSPPSVDSAELETMCKTLQELRFYANASCGMHTHVDTSGYELTQFKQLAKLWMRYEGVFASLVARSRLSNGYCRLTRTRLGYRTRPPFETVDSAHCVECLAQAIGGRDRYNALNLEAYWRHGTVEFRLHHGTVDANSAVTWIELVTALTELATTNIEIPARTGTASNLVADLRQHLEPQSKCIGLAEKLASITSDRKVARIVVASHNELKDMGPDPLIAWIKSKTQLLPQLVDNAATEIIGSMTAGLFPGPQTVARLAPAVALDPELAQWA